MNFRDKVILGRTGLKVSRLGIGSGYGLPAKAIERAYGPLTSSDCYRFCLSNSNVNLCLTGPRNEKELEDAMVTLDKGPLSNVEMERIKRIGIICE